MTKRRQRQSTTKINRVQGKTDNQNDYIRTIAENDITFCTGPSGSGKSYIASGIAAGQLYDDSIEQIVVTRPLVCAGKDIGSLPGELRDKVLPYLTPMQINFKYFLQKYYGLYLNDKKILYEPLELMRGATFDNSYMILDEAQNCTFEQIKMFITRIGQGSKVLINGDLRQTDISYSSGLGKCIDRLQGVEGVGFAKLGYGDIQRNGILGRVLRALESEDDS